VLNATYVLLIAVAFPSLTGLATMLLSRRAVTARVLLSVLGHAAAFVMILGQLHLPQSTEHESAAPAGHVVHSHWGHSQPDGTHATHANGGLSGATPEVSWIPAIHLDVSFLHDGLGGFFGLLVSGIGVLIVLYARGYFGGDGPASHDDLYRFYPTLGFFTSSMLGLVLADHTILTLVFWEFTSISSFLLIGWDRHDKQAVKLAIQAFITTGLGGLFLLAGIGLLGATTGIWRWSELYAQSYALDLGSPALVWSLVLMFIGAAAKSAQWPFHYWLPGAMAAPTPVSAFLHSATMVKAGVYLMGRLHPAFGDAPIWPGLIIPFGTVTMLYAGITALAKHDLKQIFAYTTVSQLGLLMTMYGLGGLTYDYKGAALPAIDFDITQIANHAFYKAPLFITAGAIGHVASRKLPELFGAFRKYPAICGTMLLAGYALAALPGSISFQAKELFLYAVVHTAEEYPLVWGVLVATLMTAMCNVAIFIRLTTTLLGIEKFGLRVEPMHDEHHDEARGHDHHHEHGLWATLIWLPAVPLVLMQFVGGFATPVWNAVFSPLESNVHYPGFHGHVPWIPHVGLPLICSVIAIVLGVLLGLSKALRGAWTDIHDRLYPASENVLMRVGVAFMGRLQTGSFRMYLTLAMLVMVGLFGVAALPDAGMFEAVPEVLLACFEIPVGVIIGVLICVTALALPFSESRVVRVLMLGSCGFSVVAMYVIYQAPDLALTQLFFEIISVLLFVLVLRMLPEDAIKANPGRLWRAVVAGLAGIAFGWLTLVATTAEPMHKLGEFFLHHSYNGTALTDGRGGGGHNVVNVILVDFRGFDTLGEITVLGLAAMGVWSMLHGHGSSRSMSSLLFRTAAKLILPLSLLFAAFMAFKGHNEPGGGFIGGLIAALALMLYAMAHGRDALLQLVPVHPRVLIAAGLMVALLTSAYPLLDRHAFMRSYQADVPVLGESIHFVSAAIFDFGVMLVVIGVSTGMISRLAEELPDVESQHLPEGTRR
jgi:NADH:ubiquinone oxidoreductase subunit 5 (subunit L)/multisubunit Na+/H+ antiporter MnhA subunit